MQQPPIDSPRLFCNADSFAQAFDEAWHAYGRREAGSSLSTDEKLPLILEQIRDHPFLVEQPSLARQVAAFRIRLLGL
jgi:hypothetical protein